MDETLAGVIQTALAGFASDALDEFATLIPTAFGLIVTVGVTFWLVRVFRGFIGM